MPAQSVCRVCRRISQRPSIYAVLSLRAIYVSELYMHKPHCHHTPHTSHLYRRPVRPQPKRTNQPTNQHRPTNTNTPCLTDCLFPIGSPSRRPEQVLMVHLPLFLLLPIVTTTTITTTTDTRKIVTQWLWGGWCGW